MTISIKKIKVLDIITILMYIAIFKFYIGPQITQQITKIVLMGIVVFYLWFSCSWNKIRNISTPLVVSFLLSSIIGYFGGSVEIKAFFDGVLNVICIYCLYGVIQQYKKRKETARLIELLFRMTLIYCVLSFFSIVITGVSIYGTEKVYIFGYKFLTSYFFVLLTGLYFVRNYNRRISRKKRICFIILAAFSFTISYWVHCSTTMIATAFLVIATIMPDRFKAILQKRKVVLLSICIAGLFPLFVVSLLKVPQVQYFISQVLGKSLGLTGRLHIYDVLQSIIADRPLFGYGYNSFIVEATAGYGNAQNGLLEIMVNFGVIGTIFFIVTVYRCVEEKAEINSYGLYVVLYTLIICSTVEISYNYIFFLTVFLLSSNFESYKLLRRKRSN